jgi:hypothetical protein
MSNLTFPLVNLNGTSKQALLEGYQEAWQKLDDAFNALVKIAPHGRDYQISHEGAYIKARREHNDRMVAVANIQRDLEMLVEQVAEQ